MPAKENINSAFLLLHHLVQSIKIYQIRYVILNTGDIFADPPYCCINFALASTEDESIGTLLDKSLRRSKVYTAASAGDHCDFSVKSL